MGAMSGSAVGPERIMQMAWGFAPTLMITAGVRHRVFDMLDVGPKDAASVAGESGASLRGVQALLDGLTGLGLLTKDSRGAFGLTTEAATYLVKGKPGYLGALTPHVTASLMPAWLHLDQAVATGKPVAAVNRDDGGAAFFHDFVEALFPIHYPGAEALGKALHIPALSRPLKVLDLAAGSGVWGVALAKQSPNVSVTAVDWPGVIDVTRKVADREGLGARFSYVPGNLSTADFGSGYGVATLGHILHSEGEQRSRLLLRKTYQALAPGGTIAIAEFLVNAEHTGPPLGVIFGLNMLVMTDEGRTFSFEEIAGMLRDAGFENSRLLEAPAASPLILATKPK